MSLGTIFQSIEILSKEKGIEPKIILDAVKDAMLVAARKHFRTTEDLVADFDEQTGAIQIFGVRRVVPEVADPDKETSLDDARAKMAPKAPAPRDRSRISDDLLVVWSALKFHTKPGLAGPRNR